MKLSHTMAIIGLYLLGNQALGSGFLAHDRTTPYPKLKLSAPQEPKKDIVAEKSPFEFEIPKGNGGLAQDNHEKHPAQKAREESLKEQLEKSAKKEEVSTDQESKLLKIGRGLWGKFESLGKSLSDDVVDSAKGIESGLKQSFSKKQEEEKKDVSEVEKLKAKHAQDMSRLKRENENKMRKAEFEARKKQQELVCSFQKKSDDLNKQIEVLKKEIEEIAKVESKKEEKVDLKEMINLSVEKAIAASTATVAAAQTQVTQQSQFGLGIPQFQILPSLDQYSMMGMGPGYPQYYQPALHPSFQGQAPYYSFPLGSQQIIHNHYYGNSFPFGNDHILNQMYRPAQEFGPQRSPAVETYYNFGQQQQNQGFVGGRGIGSNTDAVAFDFSQR